MPTSRQRSESSQPSSISIQLCTTLRKARSDDSEFAYHVKRAAFKAYVEKVISWNEDEQRLLHDQRFDTQDFRIINVAGTDVGVITLAASADCVRVNQLFILPENQGKGIGRECMSIIMEDAREKGLPVRLRVMKVNPRARAFYERMGFTRAGETEHHDLMEWKP